MNGLTPLWVDDVLRDFECAPLSHGTLVRPRSQPSDPISAVLHVHGYNDYFFQTHLASAVTRSGRAFYAVDLRGAGRSLRSGDVPHFMRSVQEQGDGIGAAVDAVARLHPGLPVVVHGHSTGGLTAAIWAADRPHPALAALILDSPLLSGPRSRARRLLTPTLRPLAALRPLAVVASGPSVYAAHQHVDGGGRWEFDPTLKRPEGVPVRAAWARAVHLAQARIGKGLGLGLPVLVARSDSSGPDRPDNPLLDVQDTVLDVAQIARIAPLLGSAVTELVVTGAVHELSLSRPEASAAYLREAFAWLDRVCA